MPELNGTKIIYNNFTSCDVHFHDNRTKDINFLDDGSVEIEGIIWPNDQYCASYVEGHNGAKVC